MRRRLALGAIAAVSTCTLLAGCGSSSSGGSTGSTGSTGGGTNNSSAAPKTEFTDALHALSAGQSLTTTLGLDTDSANLLKITGENGDTPLTQSQADLIASAKISIAVQAPSGTTLASALAQPSTTATGSSVRVTGTAGGTTYFTVTVLNKNIYLQVDLKGILDAAGKPDALAGITSQVSSLPKFVQDLIAGKTIEIPASTISSLTSLLQGAAQGQGSGSVPNASQVASLVGAVETAILNDITVARTTSGSTDVLELTGNVRTIASDVITAVATAFPAAASQISPTQANTAPDREVKAEASVTGGALSKLEFDFGQFSPKQADTLPIAATFSTASPNISAPAGATTVNFQDLVTFFTAFAGSTG
jgi:hypothetical protein